MLRKDQERINCSWSGSERAWNFKTLLYLCLLYDNNVTEPSANATNDPHSTALFCTFKDSLHLCHMQLSIMTMVHYLCIHRISTFKTANYCVLVTCSFLSLLLLFHSFAEIWFNNSKTQLSFSLIENNQTASVPMVITQYKEIAVSRYCPVSTGRSTANCLPQR